MGGGGDHGAADLLLGHVGAGQFADDVATREDHDAVAQPLEFQHVGGHDHDRRAAVGDVAQDAIDFGAGADIDAGGWLLGENYRCVRKQRAGENDFLLVAAG